MELVCMEEGTEKEKEKGGENGESLQIKVIRGACKGVLSPLFCQVAGLMILFFPLAFPHFPNVLSIAGRRGRS
jgi:hypothetical protein